MLLDKQKIENELKSIKDYFHKEIKKLRTGKVNPEVIEGVSVEAYGSNNPLNTVGQVQVEDAMNVKVVVWDKSVQANVEKALREANLGGSVVMDKDTIRIKFAPMTEEDRTARVKELNQMVEDTRVKMRLVRQKYKKDLDAMEGESEDEVKRSEEELQKLLDSYIKSTEEIASAKEDEMMKI